MKQGPGVQELTALGILIHKQIRWDYKMKNRQTRRNDVESELNEKKNLLVQPK